MHLMKGSLKVQTFYVASYISEFIYVIVHVYYVCIIHFYK